MSYSLKDMKKIRKKLGLTQAQLAKKANVSQSLIAKIESDAIDPAYSKTEKIFNAFEILQKKEKIKAREIMNKKIITVKTEDFVSNIIKKMKKHNISQMPVLENNSPAGLISESTIIDAIADMHNPKNIAKLKVEQVMKECPPIITPNADIELISSLLKHYAILLVAEKGKLKGLISKADVLDSIYG